MDGNQCMTLTIFLSMVGVFILYVLDWTIWYISFSILTLVLLILWLAVILVRKKLKYN